MTEGLKLIAKEIRRRENIDLYVTILLAIVVGILGVVGNVRFEIISAAILATLGLLANSLLASRRSTDKLAERLTALESIRSDIASIGKGQLALEKFFLTREQLPSFEEQLTDAQSIDICGMSLLAVATRHRGILLDKVRRGCKIRLLLLNPRNESLMQMIAPFISSLTVPAHTDAIRTSLTCLRSDPAFFNSDLVQIRVYDYPLAHAMLVINRDMPDGRLRVEMYMHSSMPANAPGFYILKKDEPRWFDVFVAEFEEHWASATPCWDANDKQVN